MGAVGFRRMKVKAAILSSPTTPFKIEVVDLEPPRKDEVLVKMMAAGVCHSDWHLVTGDTPHPMPVVAGHEGSGVVESIGEGVTGLAIGDHVCLNWAPSCGTCFYCIRGQNSLCSAYVGPIWAGTMQDGSTRLSLNGTPIYHFSSLACFAERAVVPAVCCIPMRESIPYGVSALIGCAATTGIGAVLNTAQIAAGSTVAVLGAGGVGLSVVMGAKHAGASQIIAVDKTEAKLRTARDFGATDGVLSDADVAEEIRFLTEGRGVDYAFEAVGLPYLQELALAIIRPGGTAVLAGISPVGSATNLPGAILTRQEKTVKGCYYGSSVPARDFPLYADLYQSGALPLDRLISKTYRLEEINEAYEDMIEGRTARGILDLS